MLSESQERMLMVLKPDATDVARAIFDKWDLDFMPIGQVTDTGRLVLLKDGGTACDIPIAPLVDDAPEYDRPQADVPPRPVIKSGDIVETGRISDILRLLMGTSDLASRRWIYEQYDSQVMADTMAGPGGDAGLIRVHGTNRGLAMTTDCTPRYVEADPKTGGAQAVAEAYRNITAIGATPLAITNNLNFGNPEKPEIMAQLAQSVVGMGEAAKRLDTPVVSGNVSLYNETDGVAIQPCPVIGMVGVIDDVDRAIGSRFTTAGQDVVLLGHSNDGDGWLGMSLYARHVANRKDGAPPPVDLDAERRHGDFLRGQILDGTVSAAHDISDGGLAVALVEMAMQSSIGVDVDMPDTAHCHGWAFGEDQARYLVTLTDATSFITAARAAGVPAQKIGTTNGSGELKFGTDDAISQIELEKICESVIPDLMKN
jgi:phosphoribosylformylglycinamidine synthase